MYSLRLADSAGWLGGLIAAIVRRGTPVWIAASVSLGAATPAFGQGRVIVEGIVDGEVWATDSGSRLLTRNNGHLAPVGRLQLWTGVALHPRLQLFVLGELEAGNGRPQQDVEEGTEVGIEQVALRYIRSAGLMVDVGKLVSPVGTFAPRHLSTTNPLIGSPDSYSLSYPWGIQISGSTARWDYRAALLNLPLTNAKYVPEASAAPRLALGGGFTPSPSLRVGASYTRGPYLHRDLADSLATGASWQDYKQEIVALDVRFSRGYVEVHGELTLSKYDVPGRTTPITGRAYYAELKYTWSPRFFTAARFEANDYALIRPAGAGAWRARSVSFYDFELGAGYRLDPRTLVKGSYRRDAWVGQPDGYAFALQVSHHFDVMSWFARGR